MCEKLTRALLRSFSWGSMWFLLSFRDGLIVISINGRFLSFRTIYRITL